MASKKQVTDDFETIDVNGVISEAEKKNIKARKLITGNDTKKKRKKHAVVTPESLREEFLEGALETVREVLAQANGDPYNLDADIPARNDVFKAVLPILYQANVNIDLDNLAELEPEERANKILAAVAQGKMTTKSALELVNVMKVLADINGTAGTDKDTSKLVINLASIPDTTLTGQIESSSTKIKQIVS